MKLAKAVASSSSLLVLFQVTQGFIFRGIRISSSSSSCSSLISSRSTAFFKNSNSVTPLAAARMPLMPLKFMSTSAATTSWIGSSASASMTGAGNDPIKLSSSSPKRPTTRLRSSAVNSPSIDDSDATSASSSASSSVSSSTSAVAGLDRGSGGGSTARSASFQLYPYEEYEQLVQHIRNPKHVKRFYVVRHAEGTHNVENNYKDIANLDAPLTDHGERQCHQLSQRVMMDYPCLFGGQDNNNNFDDVCFITSPLRRCIQTSLLSFPMWWQPQSQLLSPTLTAVEGIRETVNYNCDRRQDLSQLSQLYSHVDFQYCSHDQDPIWEYYRNERDIHEDQAKESCEFHKVAERGRDALEWIWNYSNTGSNNHYSQIVLCTHSAFLRYILHWGHHPNGYIPRQMEQTLDQRSRAQQEQDSGYPIFEYCTLDKTKSAKKHFESMSNDFENCELRSFCLVRVDDGDTTCDNQ